MKDILPNSHLQTSFQRQKCELLMLNTANIVNIHDKYGNKVGIKFEMKSGDDLDDDIDNLGLKKALALVSGKILFTQT